MLELHLEQVTGARALHRIYRCLCRDFHTYECIPEPLLFLAVARGRQVCFSIRDEKGQEYGYTFCCVRSLYGYILINYLAVHPEYRGQGVGGAALELLVQRFSQYQGLLLELTESPGEEEKLEARRRLYQRHGFVDVPCDYRLAGVSCQLMCRPLQGTANLAPVVHRILPEIYSHTIPSRWLLEKIIVTRPRRGKIVQPDGQKPQEGEHI